MEYVAGAITTSSAVLTSRKQVKSLDFGLARHLPETPVGETDATATELSQAGAVVGTADSARVKPAPRPNQYATATDLQRVRPGASIR